MLKKYFYLSAYFFVWVTGDPLVVNGNMGRAVTQTVKEHSGVNMVININYSFEEWVWGFGCFNRKRTYFGAFSATKFKVHLYNQHCKITCTSLCCVLQTGFEAQVTQKQHPFTVNDDWVTGDPTVFNSLQ
jgi:hypothetical protein